LSAIEAINIGAYGYIQKPFDFQQLLLMISRGIEKQEALEALQRKITEMNSFINNIPDMAWLKDTDSRYIAANKAFCNSVGMDLELLINNTCKVCFDKEVAEKLQEDDRKVMESKGQMIFEEKIVDSLNNEIWLETIKSPILDESGQVTGTVGIARNITDRVLAELETKKAKEAAEAANQAKSKFLANMSHELRTPLNHIIGFTELVVDKSFGGLNEVQEEYLDDVLHSSRHLLSLVNDILDLSKVEAGKLKLETAVVNLKVILKNSLTMIKEKAMEHSIQLSNDIEGIPETIMADERKLKQVMYNLLSNAVKFTPDSGKIHLTAGLANGSSSLTDSSVIKASDQKLRGISHEPRVSQKFIQISVSDNGIGLKREDFDRIFLPFEQADNSTSRKFQGTGLGLSLTKSLVELHGGTIRVESDGEGRGSTFIFTIPI
jgi:PAS domain S-box-containing protein